jgi:hypothetical protein
LPPRGDNSQPKDLMLGRWKLLASPVPELYAVRRGRGKVRADRVEGPRIIVGERNGRRNCNIERACGRRAHDQG